MLLNLTVRGLCGPHLSTHVPVCRAKRELMRCLLSDGYRSAEQSQPHARVLPRIPQQAREPLCRRVPALHDRVATAQCRRRPSLRLLYFPPSSELAAAVKRGSYHPAAWSCPPTAHAKPRLRIARGQRRCVPVNCVPFNCKATPLTNA